MVTDSTESFTGSGAANWPQETAGGRTAGHGAKTDAARERAILAVLSERTLGQAARRAGVGERTLRRWMAEDASFQSDLATARQATFEAGITRVQTLTAKAVETLEQLLDAKRHPAVRLGAARTLVELGVNRHDAETLSKRLADLERRQAENEGHTRRSR